MLPIMRGIDRKHMQKALRRRNHSTTGLTKNWIRSELSKNRELSIPQKLRLMKGYDHLKKTNDTETLRQLEKTLEEKGSTSSLNSSSVNASRRKKRHKLKVLKMKCSKQFASSDDKSTPGVRPTTDMIGKSKFIKLSKFNPKRKASKIPDNVKNFLFPNAPKSVFEAEEEEETVHLEPQSQKKIYACFSQKNSDVSSPKHEVPKSLPQILKNLRYSTPDKRTMFKNFFEEQEMAPSPSMSKYSMFQESAVKRRRTPKRNDSVLSSLCNMSNKLPPLEK